MGGNRGRRESAEGEGGKGKSNFIDKSMTR